MKKIFSENLVRFLAIVFYIIIFIWFTFPLVCHFGNSYTGNMSNSDTHQYFWNIYNFKTNIYNFKNPFKTDLLFYPYGTSLVMHTYTPFLGLFALLFSNNFIALNTFLFLNFVFSAFGFFLLCRYLKSNYLLAVFAGFIYSFSPYKMLRLTEHYHLLLTMFVPFFVLFFLKGFEFKKSQFFPVKFKTNYAVLCIICGIATLLSDYYAAFSIFYFCVFYALYFKYFSTFNYRSPYFWVWAGLVITVSHIILHQFKVFGIENKGGIWWSGDLLSFFVPPANSQWLNFSFFRNIENSIYHYPESVEYCMFLGFTFFMLIFYSIVKVRKILVPQNIKPLISVAFVFFLMTVPDLKLAGKSILNTPLSFLHYIPFLNNLRSPTRMFPMFLLIFLPFFVVVFSVYLKKFKYKNVIIFLFTAFTIFEYKPKTYKLISKSNVPSMINFLASQPNGSLLNIPFGIRDGFIEKGSFETKKLFFQTIHHKAMADGYISRLNSKLTSKYNTDFYNKLLLMQNKKQIINQNLKLPAKFRYILIEKQYSEVFEPFFDKMLKNSNYRKFLSANYLLYRIY